MNSQSDKILFAKRLLPIDPEKGVIVAVYKPSGPTSHDVIDRIRAATGIKKVGHGGTLDPLARGVLVVGIGRAATRQLQAAVDAEKEYIARVELGWSSPTGDAEGIKTVVLPEQIPTEQEILACLPSFTGQIEQTPPVYSAVKVRGRPAYKSARKGRPIDVPPRFVTIHQLDLLRYAWPTLELRVVCSKGTYIRSLAADIGAALNTGGYLADLERTRVGTFTVADSIPLEELKAEN